MKLSKIQAAEATADARALTAESKRIAVATERQMHALEEAKLMLPRVTTATENALSTFRFVRCPSTVSFLTRGLCGLCGNVCYGWMWHRLVFLCAFLMLGSLALSAVVSALYLYLRFDCPALG